MKMQCHWVYIPLALSLCGYVLTTDLPCAARAGDSGEGYICVCNSTYCDTVEIPDELDQGYLYYYKTSNTTPGFTRTTKGFLKEISNSSYDVLFTINSSAIYQEIEGFGAAITDNSAKNIGLLPTEAQEKVIESYFSTSGIEYNIMRIPIGGTDFSPRVYTLDDDADDKNLTNFSLAEEDYIYKIPFLRSAMNVSERGIKVIGCTWLAPAWMKNNNTHGAQFISTENYDVWARYHVRFLEEYKKEGIDVWAITGGNEVMMMMMIPKQSLLNLTLASAVDQRKWLKSYLKPQLIASNLTDVKFFTLEDERFFIPYWMERLASDSEALSYVDGIALHTYSDLYTSNTILDDMNEDYPDIKIYYTETSINTGWGYNAVILGSWDRAETYLARIFGAIGHWSRSFLDWNLALDTNGGPSMTYDIDAAVIVNETAGEFYKQPIFYAMGHFSKFVPPGSSRIQVLTTESEALLSRKKPSKPLSREEAIQEFVSALKSETRSYKQQTLSTTQEIQCIAFVNPNGSYTAIVLNTLDETVKMKLEDPRVGSVTLDIEEHSLNTFVWWP